jgi:hypothetical protein
MELYAVVTKLVGPTSPIGSTREDNERFENLKAMTELADRLLTDIDRIATDNKGRTEYSMKRAGEFCDKFLDKIGIARDEALKELANAK